MTVLRCEECRRIVDPSEVIGREVRCCGGTRYVSEETPDETAERLEEEDYEYRAAEQQWYEEGH